MRRFFAPLLLVLGLWPASAFAQLAALNTPTGQILAGPTLVVDAATGEVLLARNAGAPWYPASLAKLMTLYAVFAELKAGRLTLADRVVFSQQASQMPETKIGIPPGGSITVEQAIAALVIRSANDAAVALGERISGSEPAFAQHITQLAQKLGLTASVFRNASGWPDAAQVTSARDMAMLAIALIRDFPQYYHAFSGFQLTVGRRSFERTVKFLDLYPGADGLKTGYICSSGFNLVASAVRDGRRLVGVALGFRRADLRDEAMARLMDEAFAKKSGGGGQRVWQVANSGGVPTTVLGPGECGALTYPYPGDAVWLGTYGNEATALKQISDANLALVNLDQGPQGRVWNLWSAYDQKRRPIRFAAFLADVLPERAHKLCDIYRKSGRFCVVKRPGEIVSPWTPYAALTASGTAAAR
jgi:D-alanyl-D-alanine carboxypeptidase